MTYGAREVVIKKQINTKQELIDTLEHMGVSPHAQIRIQNTWGGKIQKITATEPDPVKEAMKKI